MDENDNPSLWRSAVDPSTNRTYWYHRRTRQSTWTKPPCLEDDYQPPNSKKIEESNVYKNNNIENSEQQQQQSIKQSYQKQKQIDEDEYIKEQEYIKELENQDRIEKEKEEFELQLEREREKQYQIEYQQQQLEYEQQYHYSKNYRTSPENNIIQEEKYEVEAEEEEEQDEDENNDEEERQQNHYHNQQHNNNELDQKLDGLGSLTDLTNELVHLDLDVRDNAVNLLLSCCVPASIEVLLIDEENPDLITNLVSTIVQLPIIQQHSIDHITKQERSIRRTSLRCLWSLSAETSKISSITFYSNQTWTVLYDSIPGWDDKEAGFIYSCMIAMLLCGEAKNVIDNEIKGFIVNWLETTFFSTSFETKFSSPSSRKNTPTLLDLDYLIAHPSPDGLSMIDVKVLQLLSNSACKGHIISGLCLLIIIKVAFQSERHALLLLRTGGYDALNNICISSKVNSNISSKAKIIMLEAMSSSEYVRQKILNSYIDLGSSISSIPINRGPMDPFSKIGRDDDIDDDKIYDDNDEDDDNNNYDNEDLLDNSNVLRDIVLKSKRGGTRYITSSTLLWSRCPLLRDLLESFWSKKNVEEDPEHLVISIDASPEVLASISNFIHTCSFIIPTTLKRRLELIAVSSQLGMHNLFEVSSNAVINLLTDENCIEVIEFAKRMEFHDLDSSCTNFMSTGIRPIIKFSHNHIETNSSSSVGLHQAIIASLQDVSDVFLENNHSNSRSRSNSPTPKQKNITTLKQSLVTSAEYQDQSEEYTINSRQEIDNIYNNEQIAEIDRVFDRNIIDEPIQPVKKGVKSGGIYGLLLQKQNTAQIKPTNKQNSSKMPGKVMPQSRLPKTAFGKSQSSIPQSSTFGSGGGGPVIKGKPVGKNVTPRTSRAMKVLESVRPSLNNSDEYDSMYAINEGGEDSFDQSNFIIDNSNWMDNDSINAELVEYTSSMSMIPEKPLSEREKRLRHTNRVKQPPKKEKTLELDKEEIDKNNDKNEIKPKSSPSRISLKVNPSISKIPTKLEIITDDHIINDVEEEYNNEIIPINSIKSVEYIEEEYVNSSSSVEPIRCISPTSHTNDSSMITKTPVIDVKVRSSLSLLKTKAKQRRRSVLEEDNIILDNSISNATPGLYNSNIRPSNNPTALPSNTSNRNNNNNNNNNSKSGIIMNKPPRPVPQPVNKTEPNEINLKNFKKEGYPSEYAYAQAVGALENNTNIRSNIIKSDRLAIPCSRSSGCKCPDCDISTQISSNNGYDNNEYSSYSYNNNEEIGSNVELYGCSDCGRKFNEQALQRHRNICKEVFMKKRKVFDSSKMRLEGDGVDPELKQIVETAKKNEKIAERKKKIATSNGQIPTASSQTPSKWKNQSDAFREAMKSAREVSVAIASGAPLPPPTKSAFIDPSLMACPHCGRTFNQKAGERHIPQCQNIKARPSVLKKGTGSGAGTPRAKTSTSSAKSSKYGTWG